MPIRSQRICWKNEAEHNNGIIFFGFLRDQQEDLVFPVPGKLIERNGLISSFQTTFLVLIEFDQTSIDVPVPIKFYDNSMQDFDDLLNVDVEGLKL